MKKTVSALVCAVISLCAAGSLEAKTTAHHKARSAAVTKVSASSPYLQCVTFARQLSGLQIFGDAWTWWEKATGKYEEGQTPKPGAVLVFQSQGKMRLGHVAVVSTVITERYIQVTHANWSPINGHRGQVEDHVNVLDVSDKGDWSKVKVWYGPLNDLGTTVYTTYGFIYQDTPQQAAAAQQLIAQSEAIPAASAPAQRIAYATPELPADLKAALTPGNTQGFLGAKAVTVSAKLTGAAAKQLVAQIDADAAAEKAVKTDGKSESKSENKSDAKSVAKSGAEGQSQAKSRP